MRSHIPAESAPHSSNERGIALITAMLVMLLMSALLVGFTTVVISDQRYRFIDKDRNQAFYAATAGVEKLTVDLGNTFLKNVAPTNAQVTALTGAAVQPQLPRMTYASASAPAPLPASELSSYHCYSTTTPAVVNRSVMTVGANGYTISFCGNTANNNPTTTADPTTIKQGAYEGLIALKTPYQIDVTAKSSSGGEVHLARTIEAVAIPVFQFGIFSDVDLAFNAADDFSFGGRVHTNGNLFLAQGASSTLTLSDKVTVGWHTTPLGARQYGEVVRQVLSNGGTIDSANDTGTVKMAKGGGAYTNMDRTWGSVINGPGSTQNEPTWTNTSLSTYKGYIKNGRTGARQLNLPLIAVGGSNTDLVRRPAFGEDTTTVVYQERLFGKASIRVLLSDTAADIMNLPGIDTTAQPKSLEAPTAPGTLAGYCDGVAPRCGGIPIAIASGPTGTAGPAPTGAAGPPTTTVTAAQSVGTGKTLTIGGGLPAYFTVYPQGSVWMKAISGANSWKIDACKTKTPTSFTGCTTSILTGTTTTIPNNATLVLCAPPIDAGQACANGVTLSPYTTVSSQSPSNVGTGRTINVASTFAFSVNTFWLADQVVTCTGYDVSVNPDILTGCTLAQAVAANDKIQNFSVMPQGTSVVGGFIKIERQDAVDSTWHDITTEILNYGIGAPSQTGSCTGTDPSPNAILRLQRLADDGLTTSPPPCILTANLRNAAGATAPRVPAATDYWPNTLFDAREAMPRETAPAGNDLKLAGVMHYVSIDARNLAKWFAHTAPYNNATDTGNQSKPDNGGYSLYISDRRNNRDDKTTPNPNGNETGEYGYEDGLNPTNGTGTPNGVLDPGEDANEDNVLQVYGGVPNCNGKYNALTFNNVTCALEAPTAGAFFTTAFRPNSSLVAAGETLNGVGRAMLNRAIIFRRAVKLVRGDDIRGQGITGLTIVTENPVYIHGDWNANPAGTGAFTGAHAATAIIGDAVTMLSGNWDDTNSFVNPYASCTSLSPCVSNRPRTANSYYRVAVLAGKGPIFTHPTGTGATFGTDGGAHNFLRMLEGNGASPDTVHYSGSLATFYYNRQGLGVFKGVGGVVYGIPAVRDYMFDTDFLTPSLLPPLTPMFRDMNAVGFSQELRPGK